MRRFRARSPVLPARRWSGCRSGRSDSPLLLAEDPVELLHRLVEVTGGGVDRRGDGMLVARLLAVAGSARLWCAIFISVFQRTPSLVSSRMMPRSEQFLANLVGAREIRWPSWPACARRSALRSSASEMPPSSTVGFEHVEDRIEPLEELERRGTIAGAELARVHGGVGVAHVLEDRGQRFGRVQIVVQARFETLRRASRSRSAMRFVDAFRRTCRSRAAA